MFYLLDNFGIPAAFAIGCCALATLILGIVADNVYECDSVALHTLSLTNWLITQGAVTLISCVLFVLQSHWLVFHRAVVAGFCLVKTLFMISWGIVGIVLLATRYDGLMRHEDCGIPVVATAIMVMPINILDFYFFCLLICFPVSETDEYTQAMNAN